MSNKRERTLNEMMDMMREFRLREHTAYFDKIKMTSLDAFIEDGESISSLMREPYIKNYLLALDKMYEEWHGQWMKKWDDKMLKAHKKGNEMLLKDIDGFVLLENKTKLKWIDNFCSQTLDDEKKMISTNTDQCIEIIMKGDK